MFVRYTFFWNTTKKLTSGRKGGSEAELMNERMILTLFGLMSTGLRVFWDGSCRDKVGSRFLSARCIFRGSASYDTEHAVASAKPELISVVPGMEQLMDGRCCPF